MRSAAVMIVLTSSGCAALFSLDYVPPDAATTPRDAALHDGAIDAPDAGIPVDAATVCADPDATIALPLIADTWLGAPAQGNNELLYGGSDGHILLKFDTMGYDIASASLILDAASFSKECDPDGNLCTSCTGSAGNYNVYLSRTDWTEGGATNTTRDGLNAWHMFAATGTQDRAQVMTQVFAGNFLVHTRGFPAGTPRPFAGPTIAFHVESAGATRSFFSKEALGCNNDSPVAPRLHIKCR